MATLQISKRKSLINSLLTTTFLVAGIILANIVFHGVKSRVDLSGEGLTAASERLVAELDETVQVTTYFGKVPTDHLHQADFVESLLDQYADAADGKLEWRTIDPFERGKEFQQQLKQDEGIDKLMWMSWVDDAPQQVPVYFHIQFKYLDKTELWVPPRQFSLQGLEYQFSSIIKKLAYPKKKLGITQGFGAPQQASAIQTILRDQYELELVDLSSPEADVSDVDVLIVNGPTQPLSPAALGLIDSHILAGKSTLFLMQAMQFGVPGQQQGMPPQPNQPYLGMPANSGLAQMLAHHGVQVRSAVVLDQRAATQGAVIVGNEGIVLKELFPLAQVVARGDLQPLQGLNLIPMPFGSSVALVEDFESATGGTIEAVELARTSDSSYERSNVIVIAREPDLSRASGEPAGPFSVGYALSGTFTSALAVPGEPAPESSSNTRMVVFGSASFAADDVLSLPGRHPMFRNLAAGATVLQNLVDWLAQDQALVVARTKGAPAPIEPPSSGAKYWLKYSNIVGAPVFVVMIGFIAWFARERRRRSFTL